MRKHAFLRYTGVLLFASLLPLAAQAAGEGYSALMASYVKPDEARDLDEGPGFKILFGNNFAPGLNWEFNFYGHRTEPEAGGRSVRAFGFGLDLNSMALFRPGQPFFLVGVGLQNEKFEAEEENSPFVNAGVGMVWPGWGQSSTSFRTELRGYTLFNEDLTGGDSSQAFDLRLNVGVMFGGGAPAPVARPRVADRDGDGDGVPDTRDRCPGTAPGRRVDANGCVGDMPDSDRDGVEDSVDQCPGTAPGRNVDDRGCVVLEKLVLGGVSFATGSANLKASARRELNDVVAALKSQPRLRVEIAGHTDGQGAEEANRALSQRRADAVKEYLVSQGIASNRLTARGYGESRPVDTNDTPAGRANNRRVEFRIVGE